MCRRWSWHGNSWSSTTTRSKKNSAPPGNLFARAGRYLLAPGTVEHRYVGGPEPFQWHSLQQGQDGGDEGGAFFSFVFHCNGSFAYFCRVLTIYIRFRWYYADIDGGVRLHIRTTVLILQWLRSNKTDLLYFGQRGKTTGNVRPPVPQGDRTECRREGVSPAGCLQDSTSRAEKGIPQTGETHGLGVKVHRKGENAKCKMG